MAWSQYTIYEGGSLTFWPHSTIVPLLHEKFATEWYTFVEGYVTTSRFQISHAQVPWKRLELGIRETKVSNLVVRPPIEGSLDSWDSKQQNRVTTSKHFFMEVSALFRDYRRIMDPVVHIRVQGAVDTMNFGWRTVTIWLRVMLFGHDNSPADATTCATAKMIGLGNELFPYLQYFK